MNLTGKTIWITGASSGIGKALALALSEKKNRLILSSRNTEALRQVAEKVVANGSDCMVLALDLARSETFAEKHSKAVDKFGSVQVLINNGGISQRALVEEADLEMDRKVMEVNFFGAVGLTKQVLPGMIKNREGHIVVISSVVGKFGFPFRSAYAASKHALHGFFESLSLELVRNNVNVTLICPGWVKTNISVNAINKEGKRHGKMDKGQQKGISPERCAHQVIKGVERNKHEVFIGGKELWMTKIKRWSPALFRIIATKVNPK